MDAGSLTRRGDGELLKTRCARRPPHFFWIVAKGVRPLLRRSYSIEARIRPPVARRCPTSPNHGPTFGQNYARELQTFRILREQALLNAWTLPAQTIETSVSNYYKYVKSTKKRPKIVQNCSKIVSKWSKTRILQTNSPGDALGPLNLE